MGEMIGELNVSRETMDKLSTYVALLEKWNPKINLVSRSTLADIWNRHIVDSAQLQNLSSDTSTNWVDIGSGGGFPGLVVAVLSHELQPERHVTLVESDQRKCAFLRTVARETGCDVTVLADRVEKIEPLQATTLSARALADLSALLGFAKRHLDPNGTCLFQKGESWEKEVEAARDSWRFECEAITSETSRNAVILRINGIEHV